MSPLLPRFLAAALGLGAALALVEGAARVGWQARPAVVERCLGLDQIGAVQGALPPGTHGARHTRFTSTSGGLRSSGRPAAVGGEKVLLVGDSFTFGVGVADDQTVPAQAEAVLADHGATVAVANGGQLALSLEQGVERAGWLLRRRVADVLLVMVTGNDLDWIPETGQPAVLMSTPPTPAFTHSWLNGVGEWLVPSCVHRGPAKLAAPAALARASAAWHYLGLHLAHAGVTPVYRDQVLPTGQLPAELVAPLWERGLRAPLAELVRLGRVHRVEVGLVVHDLCGLEGTSSLAVLDTAAALGLPLLDLSSLHPCTPPRAWDLGWDGHPSAVANAETGRAIAAWTVDQGWVEATPIDAPATTPPAERRAEHEAAAAEAAAGGDAGLNALPPRLDAAAAGPDQRPDQYPWGWWPGTGGAPEQLAWLATEGAIVLGPADGPVSALSLRARLGLPHAQATISCPGHVSPTPLPGGRELSTRLRLNPPLPAGRWLACVLSVDQALDNGGQLYGLGLATAELVK
jgi:lysophospholipase L1-like esterase